MELINTIEMMISKDYKERFMAEYHQTSIRQQKLFRMLVKYKAGTLPFVPRCSYELLEQQLKIMGQYLLIMEARAEVEGITL
jgi:hypothetical protein